MAAGRLKFLITGEISDYFQNVVEMPLSVTLVV